jgi:hypothetical protein
MNNALSTMTIGKTTVINGFAVTRWGTDTFEVGTWGKQTTTQAEALREISVVVLFWDMTDAEAQIWGGN